MPDWAPPKAADEAPVVTEASSKPFVPMETDWLRAGGLEPGAALTGPDRHAVDVHGVLVAAAAADGQGVTAGARHDARLEGQDVGDAVHRELVGVGTFHALLGGDRVAGHQLVLCRHDRDFVHLHRRGLEGHVRRDRLARQDADVGDPRRLVADEGGLERDEAGRHVVDEVVAVGVGLRPELRADDDDLRVRDGRALLVAHLAFELTSRGLGEKRRRARHQDDCRQRDGPRRTGEGAHTTLLHGHILQRCEPSVANESNDGKHALPSLRRTRRVGECDCGCVGHADERKPIVSATECCECRPRPGR